MDPRHKIRSIVPRPPSQGGDLSKVATDALVECAHDSKERWWVRAAVIRDLGRRLGESELHLLEKVLKNRAENPSVRIPALKSMCAVVREQDSEARQALVAWLQAQSGIDGGYGVAEEVLAARAGLGDVSVALELAVLASDAWTHRRACALDALRMLAERIGEDAILKELGYVSYLAMATDAPRFEVRLHGVRELQDAGEDITAFLADPSRIVARHVFDALAGSNVDAGALRRLAETAQSQEARAWAALALCRTGLPPIEAMAFLEEPLVPLAVPNEIRHAILREYVPGQRRTDPRWLLERATLPAGPSEDELEERADARLKRLMEALQALGLKPETPISAGDAFQQGSGTYFKITVPGSSMLQLSTLGPFIIDEEETPANIRAAAEACGLTWVEEYASLTFRGLCVYHFGKREPLRVGELLFYWQD